MEVFFKGKFNKKHFEKALNLISGLIPQLPKNLQLYFIDNLDSCPTVPNLPKYQKIILNKFCSKDKISFSYSYDDINVILIWVTPEKKFLKTNVKAAAGLIAHEMMHTILRHKGLDKQLVDEYLRSYEKQYSLLSQLSYSKSKLQPIFDEIGSEAVMTLKELYANVELLRAGYGDYLLEYYFHKVGTEAYCPMPLFYKGRLGDAELIQIKKAILFQLSLMPAEIPFQKYNHPKAEKLIKHLEKCYERNIEDITKEFHDVIRFVIDEFEPSKEFHIKFFKRIFINAYSILI